MPKLFYDDEFDALAQTISNSERQFKECAQFLRPDMKPDSAYAWLKDCVNPKGDQRLKFGQIISLCNFCQRYDALYFMSDECLHDRPNPKKPEDEKNALLREFVETGRRLEKIGERIERLSQAPLARVA